MKKTLKIVSRKSALALWQANHVKDRLCSLYPELTITIIGIDTQGDKALETPLYEMDGQGVFVKELEEMLLNNDADIAVHSLKDMPTELPLGLMIGAILEREDPREAFISNIYPNIQSLPLQAKVGTSSQSRRSQLLALRQDLKPQILRGDVITRIQKLDDGEYDAVLLAVAGLKRLSLEHRITQYLSSTEMLPSIGQGALSIECRSLDQHTQTLIQALHHLPSAQCVLAERQMNALLGGGAQVPIAGLAEIEEDGLLTLQALIASPDGQTFLKTTAYGKKEEALDIGETAAKQLFAQGAGEFINAWGKRA